MCLRLPTDPRLIVPPHVFPYGIQIPFEKVREVVLNLARHPSRPHEPADQAGDPPSRPVGGYGGAITATSTVATAGAQQVVETIRATICATVPVRGVPETVQERLGKRLVEDDERRPSSGGAVLATRPEEGKRPVGWRGHQASRCYGRRCEGAEARIGVVSFCRVASWAS